MKALHLRQISAGMQTFFVFKQRPMHPGAWQQRQSLGVEAESMFYY
jgi:hypothetical protein